MFVCASMHVHVHVHMGEAFMLFSCSHAGFTVWLHFLHFSDSRFSIYCNNLRKVTSSINELIKPGTNVIQYLRMVILKSTVLFKGYSMTNISGLTLIV